MGEVSLVAACGLYCGACPSYKKGKCPGCAKNEKATWCTVRSCCADKGIASCGGCSTFSNVQECKKLNNWVSKIFALLFKSDRAACIAQIRTCGEAGHAERMASAGLYNRPVR